MMDALSSKTFQPIQPDGYVLNSPGTEAPKIEITETENLCQPPLSPSGCDVVLSEWEDFPHHGENAAQGEYLAEQTSRHHHHHDHCDSRRGSLSRLSEGGPGKCHSPSRNSPRRHSPVPYSPKRQNRRSSASSVASEEFPDVNLSPRRHSPVPFSPQAERPSSLALASATTEEYICVSYADPFSSPTITHTSEAILAISINCSHDCDGDQDVEMTPDDVTCEAGSVLDIAEASSSAGLTSSSATRTSVSSSRSLSQEGCFQGSSSKDMFESQAENGRGISDVSDGKTQADSQDAVEVDTSGNDDRVMAVGTKVSHVRCHFSTEVADSESTRNNLRNDEGVIGVESMEGEEDFQVDEVTDSDSSSDEEMIDFVSSPQSYGVSMSVNVSVMSASQAPDLHCSAPLPSDAQYSSLGKCSQNEHSESPHGSSHTGLHQFESCDSSTFVNRQTPAIDVERNQSAVDHSHAQSLPDELRRAPSTVTSYEAGRRASFPDQHLGLCSSSWLSSRSSRQASPRRTISQHVSKTPEDFALSCVVGSPPLQFPHCQHAVLVHCSLPSPYDPDLPTPPIVLTPHISYEDLNIDANNYGLQADQGGNPSHPNVKTFKQGSWGETTDVYSQRPDISRSRSFPRLNQNDDRFQEPDQAWPVLGDVHSSGSSWMNFAEKGETGRRRGNCTRVSDMGELPDTATSVSLPGSPSNSRAAVMGRLRRVVERRLSFTGDCMEAALQDGSSQ